MRGRALVAVVTAGALFVGGGAVSAADPVVAPDPVPAPPAPPAPVAPPEPVVTTGTVDVTGDVRVPATLTPDDLKAFPPRRQSVSYRWGEAQEGHDYVGAALVDILNAAEPIVDPAQRNSLLAVSVLAVGLEGYSATVTWGEIASDYAGTPVIVAYTEDGNPLPQPRLIVPGDLDGGRYVSALSELRVVNLKGATAG